MNDFEVVKQMRDAIVYDGTEFWDFVEDYHGDFGIKRLGVCWNKACHMVDEKNWNAYLIQHIGVALKDFSNSLSYLYEEGVDESEIASRFGIDIGVVNGILSFEN